METNINNNAEKIKAVLALANIKYYHYSIPALFYGVEVPNGMDYKTQQLFQIEGDVDSLFAEAGIVYKKEEYLSPLIDETIKHYWVDEDE